MPRKSPHSDEQILIILKQVADGATITETCRKHGISEPTFYRWREKYGGLEKSDLTRLRELEVENARLRRALADTALSLQIQKEAIERLGKR
jgi:putative transposase